MWLFKTLPPSSVTVTHVSSTYSLAKKTPGNNKQNKKKYGVKKV